MEREQEPVALMRQCNALITVLGDANCERVCYCERVPGHSGPHGYQPEPSIRIEWEDAE